MIYRILIDDSVQVWDSERGEYVWRRGTLKGASCRFDDLMLGLDLPKPRITNRRARFYFTALGWRVVGARLAAAARRRGHVVKIIRCKPPAASRVVYRDELQVAVLPARGRTGARRVAL